LFGGLRAAAQMISYELTLSICTLCVVLLSGSVTFNGIVKAQEAVFFFFPLFPVSAIFFIAIVAETNRPPFDMAEAESELVAGYNVEYPALYFAFLFLSEYCSILIMSALWVIFF
jgi:NADH-quinone oxidoreductase subunit H